MLLASYDCLSGFYTFFVYFGFKDSVKDQFRLCINNEVNLLKDYLMLGC